MEGRRINETISWLISTKVWDQAGIKLTTPGSAFRQSSVVRHGTDCATQPGLMKHWGVLRWACTSMSESSLFVNSEYVCRTWCRPKFRPLVPVDSCVCIFKEYLYPFTPHKGLWNVRFLKLSWKMEHLLLRSKFSIFHYWNVKSNFGKYLKIWIICRKWCNVLNKAYGVKGYAFMR